MRAIICGAGIAGLALAQRLQSHGWDVCLVEHAPGPRTQGYMLDFTGSGYAAAEAMGVLPRLHQLAYVIERAEYIDARGRRRARLDYSQAARVLHGRLLSIMRPDLEMALRESVSGRAEIRFGLTITAVDNATSGVSVGLSDGSRLTADLLVGADGIHSCVRRLVFGPEQRFFRYLGFHAAAYVFKDVEIHKQVRNRFCMTDSVGPVMGFYGLRDGRTAVFAVHRRTDPALPSDARIEMRRAYTSLGWIVPRALDRCPEGSDLYYDQVAQIVVPEWSRGRVTLVGDACQAVSLLAGQGASLAVGGAYVLAEQLAAAPSIEAGLERYQEVWQPIIAEKQLVGRRGAEWFLPASAFHLWARRIMLGLCTLPGVNTRVLRSLVGKSVPLGDLTSQHGTAVAPTQAARTEPRALFSKEASPTLGGRT